MTNKFSRDIIKTSYFSGGITLEGITLEDCREKLLSLSEKIGEMVLTVNDAMTKLVNSDAFNNMLEFFRSIPDDIQDTELFQHISTLEKKEIIYEDVVWIQDISGYKTYDMSVEALKKKKDKSELDQYILRTIETEGIAEREKIVILLAHFESLVYQTITYERKSWDRVKNIISINAKDSHEMEWESYVKILLAGIVYIVFSNTDNYQDEIDRRIPFRNNILHRGTMSYSDEEIKIAYEVLVYFVAELAIREK